jgi:hypothetical protein
MLRKLSRLFFQHSNWHSLKLGMRHVTTTNPQTSLTLGGLPVPPSYDFKTSALQSMTGSTSTIDL